MATTRTSNTRVVIRFSGKTLADLKAYLSARYGERAALSMTASSTVKEYLAAHPLKKEK